MPKDKDGLGNSGRSSLAKIARYITPRTVGQWELVRVEYVPSWRRVERDFTVQNAEDYNI